MIVKCRSVVLLCRFPLIVDCLYDRVACSPKERGIGGLNEQLHQINAALRRQAKIESYAPSLSYASVGGRRPETEVIVDPKKQGLISRLKCGKNFLCNQGLEKALLEFKAALELAQNLKDPIEERKAARVLGLFTFPWPLFAPLSLPFYLFIYFFVFVYSKYTIAYIQTRNNKIGM